MTRLEKAAAFGAMMGKRAALLKHADASLFPKPTKSYPESSAEPSAKVQLMGKSYPNMQLRGSAINPAGALSGATDQPRLPSGYQGNEHTPATDAAANAKRWNYSRGLDPITEERFKGDPSSLGQARHSFHTNLTNQLKDANKFDDWNKRMGDISDEQSNQAPISHVEWPSKGYGPPRKTPGYSGPHSSILSPPSPIGKTKPGEKPGIMNTDIRPKGGNSYAVPYSYSPAGWGGPRQKKYGYPDSFVAQNNVRLHELTHTGYQNDFKGSAYTDSSGKPLALAGSGAPSRLSLLAGSGAPSRLSPNDLSTVLELGATWNEIGQGSRAFKDVTGKHMEGTHSFAPGMDMDYREMAELAKKYKVGDLHAPAGQKFMQQVLSKSKSDTDAKRVDLNNPNIRNFNNEAANAAEAHFRKNLDLPYNESDPDAFQASLRAKYPDRYGLVKPGPKFNAKGFITYPQQDGSYLPYGGYPYGPSR